MTKQELMSKIKKSVENCTKCDLCKTRKNPVIGAGSFDSDILLIGEAPGYNEDLQGRPFVGRAGKILDNLLESVGLNRDSVYIANILKCRPPDNRNPLKNEINLCVEYLNKQIEIIQPKIIMPLGSFACSYIFEKFGLKFDKISKLHGKLFQKSTLLGKLRIIPMYHPAVATYNPNIKNILIKDFNIIKKNSKLTN